MMADFSRDVLVESFLEQLLPIFSAVTAPAMEAFGGYDTEALKPLIWGGAFAAVALLYGLGYALSKRTAKLFEARYTHFRLKLAMALPVLMLFVSSPLGFVIALANGLFRVRFWIALPTAGLGLYVQIFLS